MCVRVHVYARVSVCACAYVCVSSMYVYALTSVSARVRVYGESEYLCVCVYACTYLSVWACVRVYVSITARHSFAPLFMQVLKSLSIPLCTQLLFTRRNNRITHTCAETSRQCIQVFKFLLPSLHLFSCSLSCLPLYLSSALQTLFFTCIFFRYFLLHYHPSFSLSVSPPLSLPLPYLNSP